MKVKINGNLVATLLSMGFDEDSAKSMKRFENTTQEVLESWTDTDGTEYHTVDLCCEIPESCCEEV